MSWFDDSKDYYSLLGADEDASQSEIDRLYKRLAVRHHPDRGGDEEAMKSLNEAYRVLGDESARAAYDAERARATFETEAVDEDSHPSTSPPAKVDAFTGQWVGAILFIGLGLVLVLLVRFQWIWFLWPLAVLAAFLVFVGLLMAHAAMRRVGGEQKSSRAWLGATLEVTFWAAVLGGGYGIYLIMS